MLFSGSWIPERLWKAGKRPEVWKEMINEVRSGQNQKSDCSGSGWELESQGDLERQERIPHLISSWGNYIFRWTKTTHKKRKILEGKLHLQKSKTWFPLVLNTAKTLRLWIRHSGDRSGPWSWLHISFPRKALENPQACPTPVEASEIPKNSFRHWIHAEVTMILVNHVKTSSSRSQITATLK